MVLPTIFSAHAPAAQHRARQQAAGVPAPAVTLSPLDAFLLTRIAAFLPHPLTVVDLAAVATDGDSLAVLHAADITVVSPPQTLAGAAPRSPSREMRNGSHRSESISATLPLVMRDLSAPYATSEWDSVIDAVPTGETMLVLLAETAASASQTGEHLAWFAARVPAAPILLLPLGATGTGEVLAQAVRACPPDGTRRLIALREQAPFFATSELGLIFSSDDAMMRVVLERLVAMMTGNFQFLPLVRDAVQTASHIIAIEAELARVQSALTHSQEAGALAGTEYNRMEMAHMHLEQALGEKIQYAQWLESRLNYLETEYIPWKNTVLVEMESEVRNLRASKAIRVEHVLRRILRRR